MRQPFALGLVLALALPAAGAWIGERDARASVSIAVTFDSLLGRSSSAAIVAPFESRALWEDGRIYTYTHVRVETAVAGTLSAGDEAWVRTMGGIVGKIGQVVDGEAVLTLGRPSLLFVHEGPPGALEVTARAQGQFAIRLDEQKQPRLYRSSAMGAVFAPSAPAAPSPPLAAELIHGRPVPDASKDIAAAWSRLHAH